MVDIFRQCFSRAEESEFLVTSKVFSNVEIVNSDASCSTSFSEAFIDYKVKEGVPLAWFWWDKIMALVENFMGKKSDNLSDCVLNFLENKENIKNLLKVKDASTEAEIQAILAHHLFLQLAPTGKYMIDSFCFPKALKECPACHFEFNLGNTSLGHYSVWHGNPDILIDGATVKIKNELEGSLDDEETQDLIDTYSIGEPAAKRLKITTDINQRNEMGEDGEGTSSVSDEEGPSSVVTHIEVKKNKEMQSGDSLKKDLKQAFAETITNAFYETNKKNQQLFDMCIPSFLASDSKVKILMYNCNQDRLYMSEDLYLWSPSFEHGLNVGTIMCIWLALNFENFQNKVPEEEFNSIGLKKSGFQGKLPDNILSIYKNRLKRPLPSAKKWSEPPPRLTAAFGIPYSKYAIKVLQKLDSLDGLYFGKSTEDHSGTVVTT